MGVVSTPEFFERDLKLSSDILLIVATDGLWQYMDDLECVKISSKYTEPDTAVKSLIGVSNEKWLRNDNYIDDTTICIAYFTGKRSTTESTSRVETSSSSTFSTPT